MPEVHSRKRIKPVLSRTRRLTKPAICNTATASRTQSSRLLKELTSPDPATSPEWPCKSPQKGWLWCCIYTSTLSSRNSVNIPTFKVYPQENSSTFALPFSSLPCNYIYTIMSIASKLYTPSVLIHTHDLC